MKIAVRIRIWTSLPPRSKIGKKSLSHAHLLHSLDTSPLFTFVFCITTSPFVGFAFQKTLELLGELWIGVIPSFRGTTLKLLV